MNPTLCRDPFDFDDNYLRNLAAFLNEIQASVIFETHPQIDDDLIATGWNRGFLEENLDLSEQVVANYNSYPPQHKA